MHWCTTSSPGGKFYDTAMTLLPSAQRSLRFFFSLAALFIFAIVTASFAQAQTIYGVGVPGVTVVTAAGSTALFTVNPNTGATTAICALAAPSTANAVSSLDGLIYYITREATSRLFTINPTTCVSTFVGNTTLGAAVLRQTSCPNGRMYAMSTGPNFFEITPSTGATARTLTWTGLPTVGSGDFACTTNGDMYVIAQDGAAGTPYNLYFAANASFANVATGTSVAATNIGDLGLAGTTTGVPNGLSEAPLGLTGCAASPAPCLLVSTGDNNQIWKINSATGAATTTGLVTAGDSLTDLSRSFPVNLLTTKTVTPTVALQGQTVIYTLTVDNPGPAVVTSITVTDVLSSGIASASWTCSVANAGSTTLVSTTCGSSTTGTGSINNTVSLSINGSIIYNITAVLNSTFTGTLTNVGLASISSLITNPTPGNNSATVNSTVAPAAALAITKTNGTNTLVAGQTTSYTVTVSNFGPGNAPGSLVKDPAATGLVCTTATCAVASGTAVCPVGTPSALMASLQGAGATLTTFDANSSLNFTVTCSVDATGL
jgi:uncharacterized repeat protein (TIGR01451 family)